MNAQRQQQRYWCHVCNAEVPIFMAPDLTCQHCHEQFLEEVQTEDDPREFLNTLEDAEEHEINYERNHSVTTPLLYSPLSSRYEDNQGEVGDDLFRYFTPPRMTNARRSESPPLGDVLQSVLSDLIGTERTETSTQNTRENRQRMLFLGNAADGNIRLQSMPGSMPRSQSTNGNENRENTNDSAIRLDSIASILRLLSSFTGTFDDEMAGNPDDYVFSQTALDNIISQLMEQTGGGSAPPPAPQTVIDSLVKRPLNDKEKCEEADCAVCKDEFEFTEQVTELPCNHIFHGDCIIPWLKLNGTCPVCRHTVLTEESANTESNNEDSCEQVNHNDTNEASSRHWRASGLTRGRSEQNMPATWPSNSSQESS